MRILSMIDEYLRSCDLMVSSSMVMGGRPAGAPHSCPKCGSRATYIEKYGRWFCDRCEEYVREDRPHYREERTCERCRSGLEYIKKYDRWWCDRCERYEPSGGRESGAREKERRGERERKSCHHCGSGLEYIRKYDRWWCERCESYDSQSGERDGRDWGERTTRYEERTRDGEIEREHDSRDRVDSTEEVWGDEEVWTKSPEDTEEDDFRLPENEQYSDWETGEDGEREMKKVCSSCGERLIFVEKHGRFWCDRCQQYKGELSASSHPAPAPERGLGAESEMKDLPVSATHGSKTRYGRAGAERSRVKGFEIFITVFIIILAIGSSLAAYQGFISKNKGDEEILSAEESVLRDHAFNIISNEEKKGYSSYILDVQAYLYMVESYAIMYITERDDPEGDPELRDFYWDIAGDSLNKTFTAKRSFVKLFSMSTGNEYTDSDVDVNYQEALEDYEDYFVEMQRISEGMKKDANASYDDADEYGERSDRYGYSMIILTVGTLIAGLSLLPDKRKNRVMILLFTMVIFIVGLGLGLVTFLKII